MILRGRIESERIGMTPAEWPEPEGSKKTQKYPDGFDFTIGPLQFAKDEESGDVVFSPIAGVTIVDVYSSSEDADDTPDTYRTNEDCLAYLGASWFALTDLLFNEEKQEMLDMLANAIAAREYTATPN